MPATADPTMKKKYDNNIAAEEREIIGMAQPR